MKSRELNTFAAPPGIQNYGTPAGFKDALDAIYHFTRNPETGETYDPCPLNSFGMRYSDGLEETPSWVESYIANPPYGRKSKKNPTLKGVDRWIDKAIADKKRGVTAVYLLRVDTSTNWMHNKVFPYARPIWVRGRIRFVRPGPCKTCKRVFKLPAIPDHCLKSDGHPSPFASVVAAYEPGVSFPPQSVMWQDKAGAWHILETKTR